MSDSRRIPLPVLSQAAEIEVPTTEVGQHGYHSDPFTQSFNSDVIWNALHTRYGQRYLDYRAEWARSEKFQLLDFPANLVFDLINVCNLRCPMCLRSEDLIDEYPELKLSKEKLTLDDMRLALDEGYDHGLPSVNFGGSGECTLHPNFIEISRMVMERDVMELRIITNGLRLTREVAEALIDMQAHVVSVSIDAFSPETYGKVRGKPQQYELLMQNVMGLLALRRQRRSVFPLLRVSFVRQPENKHESTAFVEHWKGLADMVEVQVHHDYRTKEFSTDFECSVPFRRLNIWATKKVGPCCGFPGIAYDVGTLGKQTLKEIWNGVPINTLRRELLTHDYGAPCLRCQGSRTPYDD